jgi:hypothetical protein
VFSLCGNVLAQDDEDENDAAEAVKVEVRPAWTDENFEQWVFQNQRNAQGARQRLDSQLALQTDDVARVCSLTGAQKTKLQLAGRGDIKAFFDRYEEVKKKFQAVKHDQQQFNQIWQDISPLQMTLQAGLFHEDSIFHKSLRNTLTDEQFVRYDVVARERRTFRHRAKIELVVAALEQSTPLLDEQRRKLIELLVRETRPLRKSGNYDYYALMLQVSRIPEAKLRLLFDEAQWRGLSQQVNQAKGYEQWLKQMGYLLEPDEADVEQTRAGQAK